MHDARTHFADCVRKVQHDGKEFLITSRGEPVAILTQADRRFSASGIDDVMARIAAIGREAAKSGPFLKESETVNRFARADLKW